MDNQIAQLFSRIASGYDNPSLRYSAFCADRLIAKLQLRPGMKILDVAAGTGSVTLAAAQVVGDSGRVTAIDISDGMLDRLQEKIEKFSIGNIDWHVMDAVSLEFRRNYFDCVICSYGIFLLSDPEVSLKDWARVAKPGGRIAFSVFGAKAFQPMMKLFHDCLARHKVSIPKRNGFIAAITPEECRALLNHVGLEQIEVTSEQFGYHLQNETEWREVIWHSAMRETVDKIPVESTASFWEEHLSEVHALAGEQGLWLDVETYFAVGTKT